ncbi:hypothetical protein BKP45_15300 [Anaerobacillus alkalidiazotrophicus]|uniref:YNCE-like beta-propeller domain-containing protein n=1 Tax=Anaerobacillus alkalidiazotrophicus TaxID=472963 RepID=A0A1S2M2B6_9BACI|nr:YncE family protein [Anaerobacillus alkalidiazotrophicus]OIJ18892.1 hypothetical protein BKP45_15300 [Anaerobacillus alkalidiazotrophicus]
MFKKQRPIMVIVAILFIGVVTLFFINNNKSLSAPVFYVANAGDGTISEIDLQKNTPVNSIELNVEQLSHGIAISPDETVVYYGTGFSGKSLHALDVTTKEVINEIEFDEGIHGIDIHPSGKYLYVTLMGGLGEEGGVLAVIDTNTFEEAALITTDDGPAHVSVSANGSQIWVANVNGNSVSAVDAYTYQVLATIPVGEVPNEVALSPNLDYAFVANVRSNSVTVIDMVTFEVVTEIEAGEGVHGVTVSSDGKQVWTANNHSNDVSVIDIETFSLMTTIETGSYANHISFSPSGDLAFVTHREANNIVVISTKDFKILKELEIGKEPHEMTLKGMELRSDSNNMINLSNPWLENYTVEKEVYVEGVEVKAQLLSPFAEEDILFVVSNIESDPFQYFAVKIDMTTHSGDLTSVPFEEMVYLTNNEGDEVKVDQWIVISNDSHHPQFLALFDKTVDKLPIIKNEDTQLAIKFRSFLEIEDLVLWFNE